MEERKLMKAAMNMKEMARQWRNINNNEIIMTSVIGMA
jgi:hypothetical protein